jgi:hypothetical protein
MVGHNLCIIFKGDGEETGTQRNYPYFAPKSKLMVKTLNAFVPNQKIIILRRKKLLE